MYLLNFSHPLTPDQLDSIKELTSQDEIQTIELPVQFDPGQPFRTQAEALLAKLILTPTQLQSAPILVNTPSLNFITALVLAELHGRMGYFPPIVRLRPVKGSLPPRYEVAEVLNLQAVRDDARRQRNSDADQ